MNHSRAGTPYWEIGAPMQYYIPITLVQVSGTNIEVSMFDRHSAREVSILYSVILCMFTQYIYIYKSEAVLI